ncbi:MAG: hypothetical protein BZY75_05315 [SAR202 cluster bacterium Io17-Chloro-G7]|nr:MAG: hypothetical protein BZY75_05315 [SAR202 cluster bacterium Io17-Chloro-G7]
MLITALISIAERVGANRIFKAEGRFHHPLGDLAMTPEAEFSWRTNLLRAATRMLAQQVDGPTVRDLAHQIA